MSDYDLKVCDNCGKEDRATYDDTGDSFAHVGWLHLVWITGPDALDKYDFCGLDCLREWASRRAHRHTYTHTGEPDCEVKLV